jgi:hypothetical protein
MIQRVKITRVIGGKYNRKIGYHERGLPVISLAAMKLGENYFWKKRGLRQPPGTLTQPFGHI